jgi:NAD(P)-dependent dehydrogenase (short-subunit alcohol dehydrogenase family)
VRRNAKSALAIDPRATGVISEPSPGKVSSERNANQLTGSLSHELAAFNVRVKLVEPGYGPTTRFTSNGGARMNGLFPDTYAAFANPILAAFGQVATVTTESDVAEVVYRAANDESGQLRFPAGADAVALAR